LCSLFLFCGKNKEKKNKKNDFLVKKPFAKHLLTKTPKSVKNCYSPSKSPASSLFSRIRLQDSFFCPKFATEIQEKTHIK